MDVGDYASRTLAAMTDMEHRLKAEFKADIARLEQRMDQGFRQGNQRMDQGFRQVDQRMDQGFRLILDFLDRRL